MAICQGWSFRNTGANSHGGADAIGFASAVDLGYDMAKSGLVRSISEDVESFQNALQQAPELKNTDAIS